MESARIHIGKPCERGEYECPACQLHHRVGHRGLHYQFQLIAPDVLQFRTVLLLVCHVLYRIGSQYFPVHSDIDEPVKPAQAVVHMSVPMSQLFLEKDFEGFGELLGDVRKGDVPHPPGFDELPQIELGCL